jgi:S-adenosylmethionine decarboxylase
MQLTKQKQQEQDMRDLAPEIYRQRAVIEGYPQKPLKADEIKEYLRQLSDVLGMITIIDPVTHRSELYGEAAWIHWETSGAHFYAWDVPRLFFSVDIYTCKAFDVNDAVSFTQEYFNASEVVFKEF